MVHVYDPRTPEMEELEWVEEVSAWGSEIQSNSILYIKVKASLDYRRS